jgi:hypothetical protein
MKDACAEILLDSMVYIMVYTTGGRTDQAAGWRPGGLGGQAHRCAIGQVVGQQFLLFVRRQLELRVREDPHKLGRGGLRYERTAAVALSGVAQCARTTLSEYQGREHQVRIEYHARLKPPAAAALCGMSYKIAAIGREKR